jgi:hypothetical protein
MEIAERNVNVQDTLTVNQPWYVNYKGRIPPLDAPDREAWVTAMLDALDRTPGRNYGATDELGITMEEVLDNSVAFIKQCRRERELEELNARNG